ncbi:MAG: HAD-IIIA family hydrolase [Limnoraphis sp. WC205]|jgi:D-glycero-D-manno-heptose 1,7-bisphosphate phosphatase|nr:HAD-IIIA family hydrolase [Limnoraphis sp. WC205]
MNKILLVDCDGTIRKPKSKAKVIDSPTDQEPIPGAIEAINHYFQADWLIVGITNQANVARGRKSLENCIKEQQYTLKLFPQIEAIYFCPDFEGKLCYCVQRNSYEQKIAWQPGINFRKPGDGMIFRACIDFNGGEHPDEAWMIGDRSEDEAAACSAGISFMDADIWRERWRTGKYRV